MKPEVPPQAGTRRYAVFLCYRHADNKEPGRQWATWLHQMLENYEIPSDLVGTTNSSGELIPASLYPVFRDEEELPADADLTRNIRQALENSVLLVVICSPRATQSRFVAEEIRYFKELGKADRILALMIDGEPNTADDSAKQSAGLTAEMECLPEPLRRGVARNDGSIDWSAQTEPIAADARPGGRPVQGWTNSAAYREQLLHGGRTEKSNLDNEIQSYEQRLELTKLKLVAGALGVPLGVLTQRDKAMQLERARKRARTLRRWLVAVAILAVLSVAAGIFAWKKQREAALERDAKEQARIEEAKQRTLAQEQSERRRRLLVEAARSDRLVAEEKLGRGESPAAFAYLARSIIYDGTTTLAAEKAFAALNTWRFATPVSFCGRGNAPQGAQFSPDGKRIVVGYGDGTTRVWEADSGKLLATLQGHEDVVSSAQFSPDGKRIVTASRDKTSRVWDADSGKLLATLQGHEDVVNSAQFSPDGRYIVTASDDKTARVWEAQSGNLVATLKGHESPVSSARFGPNGQRIVTDSEDDTTRLWEAQSGNLVSTLKGRASVQFSPDAKHIFFAAIKGQGDGVSVVSPDGQRMLTGTEDNTMQVWEAESGKLLATLQGLAMAEFSPDGEAIVTTSGDKADYTARVWEAKSGKLLATLQGYESDGWVYGAHFSSDGRYIATAADKTVRVWDARSHELVVILQGHEKKVNDATFSADGKRVVTASDDETARIWDAQTRTLLATLNAGGFVETAQFSSDGERIVTTSLNSASGGGRDPATALWESKTGKLVDRFSGENDAEFRLDGRCFATDDMSGAKLRETSTGKLLRSFPTQQNPHFSPSGWAIATTSEDTAHVWQIETGKQLLAISVPSQEGSKISTALFSPDEQSILTGSRGRGMHIWNSKNGVRLADFDSNADVAEFSPDGQHIVTYIAAHRDRVDVRDTNTHKLIFTISDEESPHFSPDGQRVITAAQKNTAELRETQSGKLVAALHGDAGRTARFSRDGTHVVTASYDGVTPLIWTVLSSSAGPPPAWFPDFLHYMAQQRLNSDGELEPIPPVDWLALRDRLRRVVRETAAQDTPYLRVLRHFVHE